MIHENIGEQELDRLCWLLVSTRNRFYPPEETAEECIEHHEDEAESNEYINVTGFSRGDEHGYHRGMFTSRNMFMEQLYGYGINVLARANRYVYLNRKHGMDIGPDMGDGYYQAVEGGAEYKALRDRDSEVLAPETIESLDWQEPYVPEQAKE